MRLRPMKNRVLLRIPSAKERQHKGIIIPSTVDTGEKYLIGQVIEIGESKDFKNGGSFPIEFEIGDKVLVGKFAGTRLHIDDKLHMTVDFKEILGILIEE